MLDFVIVSVPFPFEGRYNILQRNAIGSWMRLEPQPEIILMGSDAGVKEYAEEHGLHHLPDIALNPLGNLSCADIFEQGQREASQYADLMIYADCDVVMCSDLIPVLELVDSEFDDFLMVSGRWSARIDYEIDFETPDWEQRVREAVFKYHNRGSDYFVFRPGFFEGMPDFSIGRGWWDGWKMGYPLARGIPLINAKEVSKVVHQDHGLRGGGTPGWGHNKRIAEEGRVAWVHDATVFLTSEDVGCS